MPASKCTCQPPSHIHDLKDKKNFGWISALIVGTLEAWYLNTSHIEGRGLKSLRSYFQCDQKKLPRHIHSYFVSQAMGT